MQVSLATDPAKPNGDNEDSAAVGPETLVLIDGAGSGGADSGCIHGVAWYARHLGSAVLAQSTSPSGSLRDALRAAIDDVAALHAGTCDLDHPGTPSATVVVARARGGYVEYLVLADSVLLIETNDGQIRAISDQREADAAAPYRAALHSAPQGPARDRALREFMTAMQNHRNRQGGFWVASTDPAAADEAITDQVAVDDVRALALLSDGASRLVDRFALADWPDLMRTVAEEGPAELIRRTRAAENSDPDATRWPRGKSRDDATAVYATF